MSVHPSQLSLSRMRSDNSERMQGTLTMEFKARSHRPEGDSKDVSRHWSPARPAVSTSHHNLVACAASSLTFGLHLPDLRSLASLDIHARNRRLEIRRQPALIRKHGDVVRTCSQRISITGVRVRDPKLQRVVSAPSQH
eukprot:921618-Rhodomonas_salina.2